MDLGASSGRVIVAEVSADGVRLEEARRFPNGPLSDAEYLVWDVGSILREVDLGLAEAARRGPLDSIGVDSWGADYGLLDGSGRQIGPVVAYRDARTEGMEEAVWQVVDRSELYRATGAASKRFNTVYQLAAERRGLSPKGRRLAGAKRLALMPDLVNQHLTGALGAEVTNASTTGLIDPSTRDWCWQLIARLGFDAALFPPCAEPGAVLGPVRPALAAALGLGRQPLVVQVASHDTASAVAAVPAAPAGAAYISCGTWSLVGVELTEPVLTEAARAARFTNELGAGRTVRFLRNVSGLWLLQECQRAWQAEGKEHRLPALLEAAAKLANQGEFDTEDPAFLAPGGMPDRIARALAAAGHPPATAPAAVTRCILDSLATSYADAVTGAQALTGRPVERVHIVGGGARGELLCQLTATRLAKEVVAGPAEAAAVGNALVQAQALGVIGPALADLRETVRRSFPTRLYRP